MTNIIPESISELRLFVQAAHIDGLQHLFASDAFPFSKYDDDFKSLELQAFKLDDPILKLLIVKRTTNPKIIELALATPIDGLKHAALKNPAIINIWSDELLVPETLAEKGLLNFIESLNDAEKRDFLYSNPAVAETRVLEELQQLLLASDARSAIKGWLAITLAGRLPEYQFEDELSRSYEPPFEDWKREKLITEFLFSLFDVSDELLIRIVRTLARKPYPKFRIASGVSASEEARLTALELRESTDSNMLSACQELLETISEDSGSIQEVEFVGKIGQHLEDKLLNSSSDDEEMDTDQSLIVSAIRSIAGCMIKRNQQFKVKPLIHLLLCESKCLRLFAFEHLDFEKMSSPEQLRAIKNLWTTALELDGNDVMEALTKNEFAVGLASFVYSDAWYEQHDDMVKILGSDGLEEIESFYTQFFSFENINKYRHNFLSTTLMYQHDASERRFKARIANKNPTSTDWDSRSLDKLTLTEILDRLKDLAKEDTFSLKDLAHIQAEALQRIFVDTKNTDIASVRLPKDVLEVLRQLKISSTWHTWLLLGGLSFWIFLLMR